MCVFVRIAENRTNAKSVINAISVQEKKQKVNVHMAGLNQIIDICCPTGMTGQGRTSDLVKKSLE